MKANDANANHPARLRRPDRLFELILILRDGRIHRARALAGQLGVSERTIWRDMEALRASGLPVEGERGLGYMMTAPVMLPPLSLTLDELEALHAGLALAEAAGEPGLARAARSLSAKVDQALPEDRAAPSADHGVAVYPFREAARGFQHMAPLRAAIRTRRKIRIVYQGTSGETARVVRPLQIEYWGRVWTLTGWCETTAGFEVFRADRIRTLDFLMESFDEEPGRRLMDHLAGGGASG